MKYVLSAQDYNFNESEQGHQLKSLLEKFSSDFWKSLDSIQETVYPEPTYEAAAHQEMLLEAYELEQISEYEKCLFFAGKNTLDLFNIDSYKAAVNEAMQVYESLWSSVKEFLKAITEGGSAIGILHLILDLVGLIPGETIGIPIGTVANVINGLIYFARGMYFMGILSMIAAIPFNYVGKALKIALTPFTKVLNVLGKGIMSADSIVIKTASAELKLAAGIEKAKQLANGLQALVKFIKSVAVQALKAIGKFLDPIIAPLTGFTNWSVATNFITKHIEAPLMTVVKGSDEAVEVLLKGDDAIMQTAKDTAKDNLMKTQGLAGDGTKVAKLTDDAVEEVTKKFDRLGKGDTELLQKIQSTADYQSLLKSGASEKMLASYTKAAAARVYFDDAMKLAGGVFDNVSQNKAMVEILTSAGAIMDSKALIKAINAGDSAAVQKFFKTLTETPGVVKNLSEGQVAIARVYAQFPEQFIKHGKNFDNYLLTLQRVSKYHEYRGRIGRQLMYFWARQIAKMLGPCADEWVAALSKDPSKFQELAAKQVLEANDATLRAKVRATILKEVGLTEQDISTPEAEKEINAMVDKAIEKANKSKRDCGLESEMIKSETGSIMYTPNIQNNTYGEKELTQQDYQKLQQMTNSNIEAVGLKEKVEVVHDMTTAHPMNELFFSDNYDTKNRVIVVNESEQSNAPKVGQRLLNEGKIKSADELKAMLKEVRQHQEKGTMPETVTKAMGGDSTNVDESLVQAIVMSFDNFSKKC